MSFICYLPFCPTSTFLFFSQSYVIVIFFSETSLTKPLTQPISSLSFRQLSVTLCNLGVGATFGESILHDLPRDSTVVTKTTCELLRVEQADFRLIFEVSLSVSVSVLGGVAHKPNDELRCYRERSSGL